MGHAEVMALHDVIARYWWQRGYDVLNPMGWDSFGLPAENAAIRNDEHPATYTYANIDTQYESFRNYAISFDWSRRFNTSDPEYYTWTQWLFLKFRERGLAYRKNSAGQLVPQRPDRAGQRAGRRRPLRALRRRGDQARADPVVLQDHRLRAAAAGRHGAAGGHLARAGADRPEELDRPLRGCPRRVRRRRARARCGSSPPVRTRCSARRSWWSPPTRSWPQELCAPEQKQALEDYLVEVRKASEIERQATDRPKTGVDLGVTATNPVNGSRSRCGPPTTCWPTTAPARSWGARRGPARLGVRREVRHADHPHRPAARGLGGRGLQRQGHGHQLRQRRGVAGRAGDHRGQEPDHRLAGVQGRRPGHRQLPAARLAAEPAALLGLPDPDHPLRDRRRGAGALRPAAGAAARPARRGPEAEGRLAAGGGRGLGQHRVPDVRRPGHAGQRHDGHLRRLVVVLPALLLPALHRGAVRRGGRARSGRRPTSTSAAWSTRCCTCCTRGSSPRCCTTWG